MVHVYGFRSLPLFDSEVLTRPSVLLKKQEPGSMLSTSFMRCLQQNFSRMCLCLIFCCCFKVWMFPKIGVPPNHPILIGFSIINHPFWGIPIFGNTHLCRWKTCCFYCFFCDISSIPSFVPLEKLSKDLAMLLLDQWGSVTYA